MARATAQYRESPRLPGKCAGCPIRRFAAYAGAPAGSLKFLQAVRLNDRILPAKRNILREEKEADEVFTLYDGWAFTYKLLPDGRRQILDFLLPGSFIGLHVLWFKAMPHSVQSLTPVSLCVFDKEKFRDLLRCKPEYEWELLKYSASCQALSDERLSDLGRRTAKERIARMVLDIHDQLAGRGMVNGGSFPFHVRQEHIADALGLTKVHVSRTLRGLGPGWAFRGQRSDGECPRSQRLEGAYRAHQKTRPGTRLVSPVMRVRRRSAGTAITACLFSQRPL